MTVGDSPSGRTRSTPRVAAIIINHNGAEHLAGLIASLRGQEEAVDIIVVDNASMDESRTLLRQLHPPVRVLENPTNRGFAGGANDGIAAVTHPYILLLNPDVRLAPDHVRHLADALDRDPGVGSVQGRLLRLVDGSTPGGPAAVMDSAGHAMDRARLFRNRGEGDVAAAWDEPAEVFGVTGAACLHRRAMLDDVAMPRSDGRVEVFDERLFAWFEDVDLDWRARLRGWSAWYLPDAIGWHERGGRGRRRTPFVEELNFANRLLVLVKHDVLAPKAAPLMIVVTLAKAALLGPRVLVRALRRFGRGLPAARADRQVIRANARVAPRDVASRWAEPVRASDLLRRPGR